MRYVNLAKHGRHDWRFIEPYGAPPGSEWSFHFAKPANALERFKPSLALLRAATTAVVETRRHAHGVLVSHLPHCTRWSNLVRDRLAPARPHIAYAFNFTDLPVGEDREKYRRALQTVNEFVVFSTFERDLYARLFDLPVERFVFHHWTMDPPPADPAAGEAFAKPFICAIGGEGRDYRTFAEVARKRPQVSFVLIARPFNLVGLDLPSNVHTLTNRPLEEVWGIAQASQGLLLPLRSSETPNGHITLVAAQKLGIPVAITRSDGVRDYVDDDTAIMFGAGNVAETAAAVDSLLEDRKAAAERTERAKVRADRDTDPKHVVDYFWDLDRRLKEKAV